MKKWRRYKMEKILTPKNEPERMFASSSRNGEWTNVSISIKKHSSIVTNIGVKILSIS